MSGVKAAVVAGALTVAALSGLAGLLGAWVWYRREPPGRTTAAFWVALRVAQGSALLLAIAVGSLAAAGKDASEGLFYLYALVPLAVSFVAEQLRVASAQTVLDQRGIEGSAAVGQLPALEQRELVLAVVHREVGVMSLSALVVLGLMVRAATTAHGF